VPDDTDDVSWLRSLLERSRPDPGPASGRWALGVGDMVADHSLTPGKLRGLVRKLNYFGGVAISEDAVEFDGDTVEWADVEEVRTRSLIEYMFTGGMENLYAPIRHGEGKFIPGNRQVLDRLWRNGHVVMQYTDARYRPTMEFPLNPNASVDSIAGICDETGRVFGLMPHPEAFNHITNHPRYTTLREEYRRAGRALPEEGDGVQIWKNAVEYAIEKLV
jgi:hypothetical protein